jgi:hypothetical protein
VYENYLINPDVLCGAASAYLYEKDALCGGREYHLAAAPLLKLVLSS